jgi:hypothetical protein
VTVWQKLRGNPWFVLPTTAFAGALLTEVYDAFQAGHLVFTLQSTKGMLVAAVGAAVTSVYHLYQTPPTVTAPPAPPKGSQ